MIPRKRHGAANTKHGCMINTDPGHKHTYDAQGRMTCCTLEEKIYTQAGAEKLLVPKQPLAADHDHGHDHDHAHAEGGAARLFLPSIISFVLLLAGLAMDHWLRPGWFKEWPRLAWYVAAYLPVGLPVLKEAVTSIRKGEVFSEFFLMGIATIGAFGIGEYPEGVAVMLFYSVGEVFQTLAVRSARSNIKTLLDQRPDETTVLREGRSVTVPSEQVAVGETVQLKAGEKLGLDGVLLSERASFNTAALTGESVPRSVEKGADVLAGMVNLDRPVQVEVTVPFSDSKLSRILHLVEDATAQKAPTELFIRKFAKVYTPIVVGLAVAITLLPYFFVAEYHFADWLYRALIFLVISCPCALVISIPLGYFGGIGAASRHGILFKGGNFLDVLATVKHVVMDKTGTLTEGVFKVQDVVFGNEHDTARMLRLVNALEAHSTHPVATAISEHVGELDPTVVMEDVQEIAGQGLRATAEGKELLVGNFRLMERYGIAHGIDPASIVHTVIAVAYGGQFVGYITIADRLKPDAKATIAALHKQHVCTTMLSGDKGTVVEAVARELGIDEAHGDLLPADKVEKLKAIMARGGAVAFVGDGLNDAPVLALSDVGMVMGGLGSDAAIETADVVIQDDRPGKIPTAIAIGRKTKQVVWENVALAFAVKGIVLVLGAGGVATMWEAVFADVGVALLAILNAVRIQRMSFGMANG